MSKSHSKETNNLHSQVSRDFHKGPIWDGVLVVPRPDVFAICVGHRWPNHLIGIVYILLFQRLVSTQWIGEVSDGDAGAIVVITLFAFRSILSFKF